MPLHIDGLSRGPHAVHVRSHRKLGRHRTIITVAHPIMSELISDPLVALIDLGKVQGGVFTPRIAFRVHGNAIRTLVAGRGAAQSITVHVRDGVQVSVVQERMMVLWNNRAQS